MSKFLPDTNILQAKTERLPKPLYFSSVVFCELMTACNDIKELHAFQTALKAADKGGQLIVPTKEDWSEAGRIQFLLAQERKKDAGGKSPRRPAKVKQEIALDCLIAISCSRENITVITNDGDFWEIKRYLKNLNLLKF